MIHIAICDDEKEFVASLSGLLKQYAAETGEEIKITPYYDGMELIERYDTSIDLIFLDIQMRLLNGLRAAEHIRRMDEGVGIIFLTTLTQYGLEGYKYQAANYIIKPMKYVRLKAEMDQWLKKRRPEEDPAIPVSNDTGKYKVFLRSLKYVETFNRSLLLHTESEDIICHKSMKEMEQILQDKGFVRCHTSYIVNLSYIKGVKKLEIELVTGEKIPVSQPKRKEFMEKLAACWEDLL
ncbi:transcriptional regulatory protein YpdB [Lachnospiraceae bacterium]|nr:transcriptional regulatory protein YpdB [Lachnospiraceae bacterium]